MMTKTIRAKQIALRAWKLKKRLQEAKEELERRKAEEGQLPKEAEEQQESKEHATEC